MQEAQNQLETIEAEPPPNDPALEPQEPLETTEQIEGQEQVNKEPVDDSSSDDIAKAREMGWVPKDKWRGSPDTWRPAKEFVRRGEEFLPIIKAERNRAQAKAAELEGRMADMERNFQDRVRRLDNVSRVALQQQAMQIDQYYRSQMRQAVELGDGDRYDALEQERAAQLGELNRRSVEADRVPDEPKPERARADPETDRTVRQWISSQDWWERDPVMTEAAIDYHGMLLKTQRHLTIEDNLAEVEKFLDWKFSDRSGGRKPNGGAQRQQQPQQRQPAHAPSVEGGARQPGSAQSRAKSWNEMPPEAKRAGEMFIADGGFLPDGADPEKLSEAEMQKARANYAKAYWTE